MSNSKELDLVIATALQGQGMDQAVAKLKELGQAADAAQSELTRAFKAGEIGAEEFNSGMSKSQSTVNDYVGAVRTATAATNDHAAGHGSLASALGLSRNQMGFFTRELASAAGVSGTALTAINALSSGLGPVGIAVSLISLGIGVLTQKIGENNKAIDDQITKLGQSTVSLEAYRVKEAELRAGKVDLIGEYQRQISVQQRLDELTLQGVEYNAAYAQAVREASAAVGASVDGLYAVDQNQRQINQGLIEADAKLVAAARSQSDYASAVRKTAEDLAPLTFAGQKFSQLLPDQQAGLLKTAAAMGTFRDAVDATHVPLVLASGDLDNMAAAAGGVTAALDAADAALDAVANKASSGITVNQNMPRGDTQAMHDFLANQKVDDMIQDGKLAEQETNKRIAEAKRLADEKTRIAKSAADAQARVDKQEAEQVSTFTERVKEISQVLTEQQQANVALIQNSAASGAEKLAMLTAYLNSLPQSKEINVLLTFGGNIDLARMLGLIGSGLGGIAGGNQQGNQALFTFVGESIATQTAFIKAYGNDRDAAQRAWEAQHLKEVQGSVNSGFDMTGRMLTQIERETSQAYINAANDPTNSSRDPYAANSDDPRYRPPKYGSHGERDPVSDGRAASGATGGMGGPAVVVYANISTPEDAEALAHRVAQLQQRRGR